MAKKKRLRPLQIVPRLGPATNLRPAGAHESLKLYNRKRDKAALRREAEGGFALLGTIIARRQSDYGQLYSGALGAIA